jgi:hypothetical protein
LLPRPSVAQISPSTPFSQTPSVYVPPSTWAIHTKQQAIQRYVYFNPYNLDSKPEDKPFCTEWQQTVADFDLLLISRV